MKIHFNIESEELTIDDKKYNGFIADDHGCLDCNGPTIYSYDFDSIFCPECNEWKESSCEDPECEYCSNRPANPI